MTTTKTKTTKTAKKTKTSDSGPPEVPMKLYLAEAQRQEHEAEAVAKTVGKMEDLIQLAEEMQLEKEESERLTAEAKQHKDRYEQIRTELLPNLMRERKLVQANGKGSFTFPGGKIHLETKLHASCTVANKPTFFEWLKKNGHGDLIKFDVTPATIASLVRERREEGLKDPPGVSIHTEVKAKITK